MDTNLMSTDEINRLNGRIEGLSNLLTEVRDAVRDVAASMSQQQHVCMERMGTVNKHIDAIHKTLYGNGREGVEDRVKGIETLLVSMTDDRKMQIGSNGQISVKAVVSIIAAVSAMAGGMLAALPAVIKAFMS